ncbi:YcnI family copper-binding membrane protein [Modestobacter altitudinis]|uniref:YcnI family copper-binding membrane protein n=1 Tax=Modestobacter altitudinis TaxID=2213158 RepID=UPI00110CA965|nr:YcnI family protein [Modestobacter altitudinis]
MSLLRPLRRLPVVLVAAGALLVAGTGIASAHVTVSSTNAAAGGYGKVTFSVPDESDAASTVGLRIQLPTETPLTSVRAQPVPGWTVTLTTVALDPPVTSDDGDTIDSAVSVVDFQADPGTGIAPGQFQEFALSGGPFPDVDELTFNVVQTYSDGSEAAWIEPTVDGQPEPEHPAPVLSLTAAAAGTDAHGAAATTSSASAATDDGGDTTATVALVLAVLGLLAGLAGLGLGLGARRRTVSS